MGIIYFANPSLFGRAFEIQDMFVKKGRQSAGLFRYFSVDCILRITHFGLKFINNELAFVVSGSLPSLLQTWFLAFLDAGIAGQQAILTKGRDPIAVEENERASETQANSFGLPRGSTTVHFDGNVILLGILPHRCERSQDIVEVTDAREVDCRFFIVHGEGARATNQADTRSAFLTTTNCFIILCHRFFPFSLLTAPTAQDDSCRADDSVQRRSSNA